MVKIYGYYMVIDQKSNWKKKKLGMLKCWLIISGKVMVKKKPQAPCPKVKCVLLKGNFRKGITKLNQHAHSVQFDI